MKIKALVICAILVFLAGAGLFLLPPSQEQEGTATPDTGQEAGTIIASKSPAEEAVEAMSLKEKVGQMFLVCVSNSTISIDDIKTYKLGGYLFFADFFQVRNKETASMDIASYQEASSNASSVPMLMAVDEEGGTVVRISKYPAFRNEPFSSPQVLYQQGGLDAVLSQEQEKADLLLSLGINVNLAPVCDMAKDKNSFIYSRTLGKGTKETSDYIAATVSLMNANKIGSALKHFPGYGGNTDTHTGIARDIRPYKTFQTEDFLPFQAGINADAPCVLVSHNIVESMDPKNPASLSEPVHQILRNDLGFNGVILTDDLIMEGVQGYSGDENIAVAAIQAGNDLLCTSGYKEQIPAVLQAVKDGKISEAQITESALRILNWKEQLGLLPQEKE